MLLYSNCFAGIIFDGTDDSLGVGTLGNFGTGLDTNYLILSCWFKTTNTTVEQSFTGTLNTGTSTHFEISLNVDDDGSGVVGHNIFIRRRDEDGATRQGAVEPGSGVCDGAWHSLVAIASNTVLDVWLDKVDQSFLTQTTGNPDNMANIEFSVMIGARDNRGTVSRVFDGELTECAIWSSSTAPSQAEVDLLGSMVKRMPLQIKKSDLIGYWAMDDEEGGSSADGDTFIDLSGNGNTGTGDNGANNTGLTATAESVLTYP